MILFRFFFRLCFIHFVVVVFVNLCLWCSTQNEINIRKLTVNRNLTHEIWTEKVDQCDRNVGLFFRILFWIYRRFSFFSTLDFLCGMWIRIELNLNSPHNEIQVSKHLEQIVALIGGYERKHMARAALSPVTFRMKFSTVRLHTIQYPISFEKPNYILLSISMRFYFSSSFVPISISFSSCVCSWKRKHSFHMPKIFSLFITRSWRKYIKVKQLQFVFYLLFLIFC